MSGHLLDDPRVLPRARGPRRGRATPRLLALLALGAFFLTGVILVAVGLGTQGNGSAHKAAAPPRKAAAHPAKAAPQPAKAKPKRAPAAPPIAIHAVGAYDPAGDHQENDSSAVLATDGNPSTMWHTEHYRTWYKPGVGIVFDAGHPVRPTALTVQTDDPGWQAEVQIGSSPTGPFTRISQSATTTDTTIYRLRAPTGGRYVLLWITRIPDGGAADVNEVRLR
jgi:hypothetical protein